MFFASAIPAFLAHTRRVVVLEDGDVVTLRADGAEYTDVAGEPLVREETEFPGDDDAAEKGGYETFMLKEIHEQPAALRDTLAGRLREDGTVDLSEVGIGDEMLRRLRRVFIVACGTSYHAGLIVSYAIEQLARVPVQIDVASEFRYRQPVFDPDTLVIGITQSGETADTLAAMRLAREAGSPVLALTNIMGSQATRDADFVLYTRAGLEIGVAATKTHTAQVAAMLLLALRLAWARGSMSEDELKALGHELAPGARAGRAAARPSERDQADRRALPRRALLPLPGPRHGLRRLPRGRAQAQGDQLHPDRGVRRRRDEARADRPARRRVARRGRRRRRAGVPQARQQHRGGPGPRRRRDRRRDRRQRGHR